MKPATEILLSAAFALTPEENWTKGTAARAGDGERCPTSEVDATSFCMSGALWVARDTLKHDIEAMDEALLCADQATGQQCSIGTWNDEHTHAEVLAALYKAAEIAEAS